MPDVQGPRNDAETVNPQFDQSTAPEPEPDRRDPDVDDVLALVVLWHRDDPWRVGESALLPADAEAILGRGPGEAGGSRRAVFGRQRPGGWTPSPAFTSPSISRQQLRLISRAGATLTVENVGQASLLVNGEKVVSAECRSGDVLQVGARMLLLCTRRPVKLAGEAGPAEFEFGAPDPHGMVGESPAIWALRSAVQTVARRSGHVLVTGPTGTGKELVARALHALSGSSREIVARNAATLPETLIDAELFGNAKNYPNPGMPDRPGLVGEAHESTLFLDEIGELPISSQARLLRVLDAGEYQRLGESKSRTSRFRLIAATNRAPGALKEDLGARFALRVAVPDLDVRREDIPFIALEILRSEARAGDALARDVFPGGDPASYPDLPLEMIERLVRRKYTGHVRELRRLVMSETAGSPVPDVEDAGHGWSAPPSDEPPELTADAVQRCLDEHNGSIDATWRALGLSSRFVLHRLIRKHGLEIRRRSMRPRG
jgi:two-component system nitrogen regulation response regulator GlnG/two-component system response regulator HydG